MTNIPTNNELRTIAESIDTRYGLVEFYVSDLFGSWEEGYPVIGHTINLMEWKWGSLHQVVNNRGRSIKFKYNPKTFKSKCKEYSEFLG